MKRAILSITLVAVGLLFWLYGRSDMVKQTNSKLEILKPIGLFLIAAGTIISVIKK